MTKQKKTAKQKGRNIFGIHVCSSQYHLSQTEPKCSCRGNMNIGNPKEKYCPCCHGLNPSYIPELKCKPSIKSIIQESINDIKKARQEIRKKYPTPLPSNSWEKEFDKNFSYLTKTIYLVGSTESQIVTCGEEIKNFIRNLLSSHHKDWRRK